MKKIASILAITTLVGVFWACKEDDPVNLAAPNLKPPTAGSIQIGKKITVDFEYTAAAGFTSSVVVATGGAAEIVVDGTLGATSGTISVAFTAGIKVGAGSITLTITDAEGDAQSATAVMALTDQPEFTITSNISVNTTWETGSTYILAGRVAVLSGVTLTIQPGVVVKGNAGTGANATALLVARGAKLIAEGTATLPIIFTSAADKITPENVAAGNFVSPNLTPDINGLWGGVIILGKAQISGKVTDANGNPTFVTELQIEGIPTSDANGLYGGINDADNSGSIKYISIRHGGTNIGSGNEINGLTLGGVGSGTVIENVEVVANQDDGIEWFGGTVNIKNIVVWNVGDDGLDTDQAWSGTADNFVVITPAGHNFELDGPEGSFGTANGITTAFQTFKNGTVVASDAEGAASENLINFDDNSGFKLENVFITGIDANNANHFVNKLTATKGISEYTGVVFNVNAPDLGDFITKTKVMSTQVPAGITAGTTGTKADVTVLAWTWAGKAGKLEGL